MLVCLVVTGCWFANEPAPAPTSEPDEPKPTIVPVEPASTSVHETLQIAAEALAPREVRWLVGQTSNLVDATIVASTPAVWRCNYRPPGQRKSLARLLRRTYKAVALKTWKKSRLLRRLVSMSKRDWQKIWKLYMRKGVCQVAEFVQRGTIETTLMGHRVRVHRSTMPYIARANMIASARGYSPPKFSYLKGFSARRVRGPFGERGVLSNHALGLAIDVEPHDNPYFSARELKLIEEIGGVTIQRDRDVPVRERHRSFRVASDAYLANVGAWLDERAKEKKELSRDQSRRGKRKLKRLEKRYDEVAKSDNMQRVRKNGFMTLPEEFVVIMEEAGFEWATHWKGGADLMHFSVRERP